MFLSLYRFITYLSYPLVRILLVYRRAKGKEDVLRMPERLGYYKKPRPEGRLIWLHGASVGECLSMMPLINYLVTLSDTKVLVTSGTVTSAELMAKRLPNGAFHQFMPVDLPMCTKRFVEHFRPDLGLFFESDFWPNMLIDAHKAGVPMVLLNGRISDKSFAHWQKLPFFIRPMLRLFNFGLGQTPQDAERMKKLGFQKVDCVGNLKFAAVPAPYDENELTQMHNAIGTRFVWVAGSTHDDEEVQIAQVHQELAKRRENMLTIIAPRHPNRADEIEQKLCAMGLKVHRRSRDEDVNADVYLADTIGEMGLIYRLAPIVFVGGSLVPFGGQNMLEPMRIGACTIIGPYAFNFRHIVQKAKEQEALIEIKNKNELAVMLDVLVSKNEMRQKISRAGQQLASSEVSVLTRVIEALNPYLMRNK